MYSKIAQEEDNKVAGRCQNGVDGTLIFVSPHDSFNHVAAHKPENIGWSFLGHSRHNAYCNVSRSETKPRGYLRILSREDLSASRQPEFFCADLNYTSETVLSTRICHLGERASPFEWLFQYCSCPCGDLTTAVGTTIYYGHSTAITHSTPESQDPCDICQ